MGWQKRFKDYVLNLGITRGLYETIRTNYVERGKETRLHSQSTLDESVAAGVGPLELRVSVLTGELTKSREIVATQNEKLEVYENTMTIQGHKLAALRGRNEKLERLSTEFYEAITETLMGTVLNKYPVMSVNLEGKVRVTPPFAKFLGYENEHQVRGLNYLRLIKDKEETFSSLLKTGNYPSEEVLFSRKDGKEVSLKTDFVILRHLGKVAGVIAYKHKRNFKREISRLFGEVQRLLEKNHPGMQFDFGYLKPIPEAI